MLGKPFTFSALLALASLCGPVRAELVAYWPLDTDADDALGNHHGAISGGVVFGAEGAAEHSGTAAEFNGSSATITVPHSPDLNPPSFTLSMWANADSTGGFASAVTSRDDDSSSVNGYIIYNDSWRELELLDRRRRPARRVADSSRDRPVQVGSWTHLAISYSGGHPDQDASTSTAPSRPAILRAIRRRAATAKTGPSESEDLHIGAGADNGSQFYFDGLIDDVALWDEVTNTVRNPRRDEQRRPGRTARVTSFTASPPFIDPARA